MEYKEDWLKHNFDEESNNNDNAIRSEFVRNIGIDEELFDEEQLEYLSDFLKDYRLEICKHLAAFICKSDTNGKSKKNIDALFVRIAGRAALLDDILNNREVKINLWKDTYGTSTHQRYDAVTEMIEELKEYNPFIEKTFARR